MMGAGVVEKPPTKDIAAATRPAFRLVRKENVMNPALIATSRQILRGTRAKVEDLKPEDGII